MSFEMIAILGRGIQRLEETSPVEDVSSWVLTEDLELCDRDSAHLPVRAPADDDSPYNMIGGGEMNLEAGLSLIRAEKPRVAVCAFGGRSDYLESINGPSESEVMSHLLIQAIPTKKCPLVNVWKRQRQLPVPSNTRQELLNIFDLALQYRLNRIAIVTIGVHIPRTQTYVTKHLSVHPQYRQLVPIVLESEEILLTENWRKYPPRVETMRKSKSFARNWEREAIGISKIVRAVDDDAKPKVMVPAGASR